MLGYEGGYSKNYTWNGNRLWGANESRMTKTSDGLDTQNSNKWLAPTSKFLELMYDWDENRTDKLIHSDFTISIIDKATGEYPTWVQEFREYGTGSTIGKTIIDYIANEAGLPTVENPMKAGVVTWLIGLKMNWLQDTDTNDRVLEITFTYNETGESITHTLTQDGSLAANLTPLNMEIYGQSAPVQGGNHSINLQLDGRNTFAAFNSPGRIGTSHANYYEGPIPRPNFEVTLIDSATGLEPDWVSFTSISNYGVPGGPNHAVTCNINLEFQPNNTGILRYYDIVVRETNHDETVESLNLAQKQIWPATATPVPDPTATPTATETTNPVDITLYWEPTSLTAIKYGAFTLSGQDGNIWVGQSTTYPNPLPQAPDIYPTTGGCMTENATYRLTFSNNRGEVITGKWKYVYGGFSGGGTTPGAAAIDDRVFEGCFYSAERPFECPLNEPGGANPLTDILGFNISLTDADGVDRQDELETVVNKIKTHIYNNNSNYDGNSWQLHVELL